MANLVSSLIIKLVDGISGPAKGAAASLKQVEQTVAQVGKSAGGAEKVAKSIQDINKAASNNAAIGWSKGFAADIGKLGLSADKVKELERTFKEFYSTLGKGKTLLDNLPKLDVWEKDTLAHLRRVEREARKFGGGGGSGGGGNGSGASAGGGQGNIAGLLGLARGALPTIGAGYAAYRLGKFTVHNEADWQREKWRGALSGMTPEEIAEASAKAHELSMKYRNVGQQTAMEHIRKLRGTLGDQHHALEFAEQIVQAQSVLSSGPGGAEGGQHDLEQLTKGLEGAGYAGSPDKFGRMLNAFVKAKNLYGETLSGEDFRTYLQRSKSSKLGLDEEYLALVAPTMIQHEGADQFGTAQATTFSSLIGRRQTDAAKKRLHDFGVLGKGDELKEKELFIRNPYEWATKFLKPKMEAAGMKLETDAGSAERNKAVDFLATHFSNRNAGEYFASLLANQGVIEKDKLNLQKARGMEAAQQTTQNDPYQAWASVVEQSKNLATNIFENVTIITNGLNGLASALATLADYFKGDWWQKAKPEDKKAYEDKASTGYPGEGLTFSPDDADKAEKARRDAEAAERDKRRSENPNTFNFGMFGDQKGSEAAAAGEKTGSSFRENLQGQLKGAEDDINAFVAKALSSLSFSASPTVTPQIGGVPATSGPAPATAPSGRKSKKQSAYDASMHLGALTDDHMLGSLHDHEFA
ncbi:hypothetical protein [Bradyrhizobium sp. SZCCHNS1012]|uniref:hypothetical protein n=1 Tax=Bradyrhizobium sp. SZCCHNS1012 TaxID=3057297 RepID=UPI002916BCDF|nr:hypothetical protein [Bradyrhizobium sp. SZCCHNS1012]